MSPVESLTASDMIFFDRMAVYMKSGMSFDESAKQVCNDDKKIVKQLSDKPDLKNNAIVQLSNRVWKQANNLLS